MIVTRTPLRVSLLGGGSDFPAFYSSEPGCVLAAAIDKYVYVCLNRRYDDRIRVSYTRLQTVRRLDDLRHDLVREALRHVEIAGGVEVATMADIPTKGTGLGSSSAVTVGVLNALSVHLGTGLMPPELAEAACAVEIDRLGKHIGKQDQYLTAHGGLRFVEFTADEVRVEDAAPEDGRRLAEELVARLLLFFSGDARGAEDLLKQQWESIEKNRAELRALAGLARQAREALQRRDLDAVGELMGQGWELKKRLADGISNPKIDRMYELAVGAGALGGKVTGAGGRGYMLFYVRPQEQEAVRRALARYRELPFGLDRFGSRLLLDARAGPAGGRRRTGLRSQRAPTGER